MKKTEKYSDQGWRRGAERSSASSEAINYYHEALNLYLNKYGDTADPEKLPILEKYIALAFFNKGQLTESIEYFDKVLSFYGKPASKNSIMKILKFSIGFIHFLIGIYLPAFKWKKAPSIKDEEFLSLYYKKILALGQSDPEEMFIQSFNFFKYISKFEMTQIENRPGIVSTAIALFSYTGISFRLSKKIQTFIKEKIDVNDVRSVIYYEASFLLHSVTSGEWKKEIIINHEIIDRSLKLGEFYFSLIYIFWNGVLHVMQGNFSTAQWAVKKLSDISEMYDNEFANAVKYLLLTPLLLKFRRFQETLNNTTAAIQFLKKTGLNAYLIHQFSVKARIHFMLGDIEAALDSIKNADLIKSKESTVPEYISEYVIFMFVLELYRLEEALNNFDQTASHLHRHNSLESGAKSLKIAKKYAPIRTEVLKLMGVYYWLIGKQKKSPQMVG